MANTRTTRDEQIYAGAILLSAVPAAIVPVLLRIMWRMIPRNERGRGSLQAARRYAPAQLVGLVDDSLAARRPHSRRPASRPGRLVVTSQSGRL